MPLWKLDLQNVWFPPPAQATAEGLLAVGGDLRPERLLLAYRSGIFPWYGEDDPILWWSPDPRFVLYPHKLHVSHSMKAVLKRGTFEYRSNTAFEAVIRACAEVPRTGMAGGAAGTWIGSEMIDAYIRLHRMGLAHSAEAWQNGALVGGLYGVRIGAIFFGESMFSQVSNASKAAFIHLVRAGMEDGLKLIDCQMHTPHLERLGGEAISRSQFLRLLREMMW